MLRAIRSLFLGIVIAISIPFNVSAHPVGAPINVDALAYKKLSSITYFINNSNLKGGTAFAVGPHTLLTARHVVDRPHTMSLDEDGEIRSRPAKNFFVKLEDTKGKKLGRVTVEYLAKHEDWALLSTSHILKDWVDLTNRQPKIFTKLYTGGFPLLGDFIVTDGRYFGKSSISDKAMHMRTLHQMTIPIVGGNSGGAIIFWNKTTERFEVVGVVSAVRLEIRGFAKNPVPHLSLMVPASVIDMGVLDDDHSM